MLELVFTSAKEGLIPGRSGFCSVAWTEGMPMALVSQLENMSGYNVLYPPDDPNAGHNPVCFSYQKMRYGQKEYYVLSRISFAGLDYTGRTNKIAHHIVLEDKSELDSLQNGPVSALLANTNFLTSWNEFPRLLPRRKKLDSAQIPGLKAEQWSRFAGHAEWAAVIADAFLSGDDKKCLYLEYDQKLHGDAVLFLINEVARVLPREFQSEFTFNTYFAAAQPNVNCFLRAVLTNSQALPAIKRFRPQDLISLLDVPKLPQNLPWSPSLIAATRGVFPQTVQKKEDPLLESLLQNLPDRPVQIKVVHRNPKTPETKEASQKQDALPSPMAEPGNSAQEDRTSRQSKRNKILLISLATLLLLVVVGIAVGLKFYCDYNDQQIQAESNRKIEESNAASEALDEADERLSNIKNSQDGLEQDRSKITADLNKIERSIASAALTQCEKMQTTLDSSLTKCEDIEKRLNTQGKEVNDIEKRVKAANAKCSDVKKAIRGRRQIFSDLKKDIGTCLDQVKKKQLELKSAEEKKSQAPVVPAEREAKPAKQSSKPVLSAETKRPTNSELYGEFCKMYSSHDEKILAELKRYFYKNGQSEKDWIREMVQTFLNEDLIKRKILNNEFKYPEETRSAAEKDANEFLRKHGLYMDCTVDTSVSSWRTADKKFTKCLQDLTDAEKKQQEASSHYIPPIKWNEVEKLRKDLEELLKADENEAKYETIYELYEKYVKGILTLALEKNTIDELVEKLEKAALLKDLKNGASKGNFDENKEKEFEQWWKKRQKKKKIGPGERCDKKSFSSEWKSHFEKYHHPIYGKQGEGLLFQQVDGMYNDIEDFCRAHEKKLADDKQKLKKQESQSKKVQNLKMDAGSFDKKRRQQLEDNDCYNSCRKKYKVKAESYNSAKKDLIEIMKNLKLSEELIGKISDDKELSKGDQEKQRQDQIKFVNRSVEEGAE